MINKTCILSSSEIGLGLTGFGVFFSFLGIVFFFDKGLIAMGNVNFLFSIFSSTFSIDELTSMHMVNLFSCILSDTLPVRFGYDNWSEINYAVLHKA